MLGHQALVSSSQASLATAGATVTGAVNVPQTSAQVLLNVSNGAGVLVKQIDLGAQPRRASRISLGTAPWATVRRRPPGQYTLSAQVAGVGFRHRGRHLCEWHRAERDHGHREPAG